MKPARTLLHLNAAQKSPSVIRVRLLTLSHSVGASAVGVCLPIKNINSPWLILRLNTMRLYPASAEVANQNG